MPHPPRRHRARNLGVELHHPDVIEHEGDCAGLCEIAARPAERGAHLAGSAVAVIGQDLDDDGHSAGAVALIADLLVALGISACRLPDGTLYIVLRHVLGPRGHHRGAQSRVHGGIGYPQPRGDGDLACKLAKQLGFCRILPPLAVHDVLELRMSGHDPFQVRIAGLSLLGAPSCRKPRGESEADQPVQRAMDDLIGSGGRKIHNRPYQAKSVRRVRRERE
jgi:hypothetical protein